MVGPLPLGGQTTKKGTFAAASLTHHSVIMKIHYPEIPAPFFMALTKTWQKHYKNIKKLHFCRAFTSRDKTNFAHLLLLAFSYHLFGNITLFPTFNFRFCKTKQNEIHQRGKSMKQNNNLNRFQQLLFHTFPPLMYLILFGLTKTETAKTAPRAKNWVLRLRGGRHILVPRRDLARFG